MVLHVDGEVPLEQRAVRLGDVLEVEVAVALPRLHGECRELVLLQTQSERSVDVSEWEAGKLTRWDIV